MAFPLLQLNPARSRSFSNISATISSIATLKSTFTNPQLPNRPNSTMPTVLPSDYARLKAIYSEEKGWSGAFHYEVCPDCKEDPPYIVEDFKTGDCICGSCGLVLEQSIVDTRAEWRTFSNDDKAPGADPNRVGDAASESLIGDQLTTSISTTAGVGTMNKELQRAQTKIVKGGTEGKVNANLKVAFKSLEAYVSSARLSQLVYDTATRIMKVCMLRKVIKSNPAPVEYAVILYKATKHAGQGREMKECLAIVNLDPKRDRKLFSKTHRKIDDVLKEMSLQKDAEQRKIADAAGGETGEEMKRKIVQAAEESRTTTGAKSVLPRFCEVLGLKPWQRSMTEAFADAIDDTQALDSRGPSNIAATSLFIATALLGSPISMKQAATLAGMSANTIKKAFVLATERKDQIINSTKFPKGNRINLALWPEIDGRGRVHTAPPVPASSMPTSSAPTKPAEIKPDRPPSPQPTAPIALMYSPSLLQHLDDNDSPNSPQSSSPSQVQQPVNIAHPDSPQTYPPNTSATPRGMSNANSPATNRPVAAPSSPFPAAHTINKAFSNFQSSSKSQHFVFPTIPSSSPGTAASNLSLPPAPAHSLLPLQFPPISVLPLQTFQKSSVTITDHDFSTEIHGAKRRLMNYAIPQLASSSQAYQKPPPQKLYLTNSKPTNWMQNLGAKKRGAPNDNEKNDDKVNEGEQREVKRRVVLKEDK